MKDSEVCVRSSAELWTILLGRSALREPPHIQTELERHRERLCQGLSFYKAPSSSSAGKLQTGRPLDVFALRLSTALGLDQQQSVNMLQCYLQEDFRGSRGSLQALLQDERQSRVLLLNVCDYYHKERLSLLRCVLLLLTYFQDDRHPYKTEFSDCVTRLEQRLAGSYRSQLEKLLRAEAPIWETHGDFMTERQASHWFLQCLREQSLLLEVLFLYYAHFEMSPADLLAFTKLFQEVGFGLRQTNRHLMDKSMNSLLNRIGYFCSLILVEGMDVAFLHQCALEGGTHRYQFSDTPEVIEEMDRLLLTFGDVPHHGPVLLAWLLLRHTLKPDESGPVVRTIGNASLRLGVFRYLSAMLQSLCVSGENCTANKAKMCIYGLLSFVISSFEEETLGDQQDFIDAACHVLSAPGLPELFWETSTRAGLGTILDGAVGMFPHKLGPLLQLMTALLSNKSTAKRVYAFLDKMSSYTEVYKHKPNNVKSRDDDTLWRRLTARLLYPLGHGQTNLQMPQGVPGQVGGRPGGQFFVVRWDFSFSSWTLFLCEFEMLLHVATSADEMFHCERVKPILDLVHKMIIHRDWTVADSLSPLTKRISLLLQRLMSFINPPLDAIASCVNCLAALASRIPEMVWSGLDRTGFLPFASRDVSDMDKCVSTEGMKAGNYGNLLVLEKSRGEYPVTIAFLSLVTTLLKSEQGRTSDLASTHHRGLIPCILLVLKNMLPVYPRWRYSAYGVKERIGCLILELIHPVLHLTPELPQEDEVGAPALQSVCVHILANTEAGLAVVDIMAVGADAIHAGLAARLGGSRSEGSVQTLIQTVKLALSVTNDVMRLKPPPSDVMTSPLQRALTRHRGRHGDNLIAVLAKYVYHKHEPALPRLAVQLLKRLAVATPMSFCACLGGDAAAVRDAFLTRLQSRTEDLRLKVEILEFLSVAVETQPGLIELFLNLEVKDGSRGSNELPSLTSRFRKETEEFLLGECSYLHVVLDLIDSKSPCPPPLHRAALAFLLALWQDRSDSVISVLRTKERFWENLSMPLFPTLASMDTPEPCILEICAFVMMIIGLEVTYVDSVERSLRDVLHRFSSGRRFEYWTEYVKSLVLRVAETEEECLPSFSETQTMISAWGFLLRVSATHSDVMQLTDDSIRLKLFMDVMDGIKAALTAPMSLPRLRLGSTMASLLLGLLEQWRSVVAAAPDVLSPMSLITESVLQAEHPLMDGTKAKVFSALIAVLQIRELRGGRISQLPQLLLRVCETVKYETLVLMDITRHVSRAGRLQNNRRNMEMNAPQGLRKVCVLALHLAKELCAADEDGEWLSVMRKQQLLPSLLHALELSLLCKKNVEFTEAVLQLLITLAHSQQGAAVIAGAAVTKSICLPLLNVYEVSSNGGFSRKCHDTTTTPCWTRVYQLCMSLMECLLKMLHYSFINEALDFVGVHQEGVLRCLSAVRSPHSLDVLDESDCTLAFLLQLSGFCREWQFHLPRLLRDVQVSLCSLCQTCTYVLQSKTALCRYLRVRNGEALPSDPLRPPQTPSKATGLEHLKIKDRPFGMLLATDSEHYRVVRDPSEAPRGPTGDKEAAERREVEQKLLKILSKTLSALHHFTPDCSLLLPDQRLDPAEFRTLFVPTFTTSPLNPDAPPSFGTLVSAVNVALTFLGGLEKKPEIVPWSEASSEEIRAALRSLLMFTMEQCVSVLISQAVGCLKDPSGSFFPRDKQRLKQELSSEMSALLSGLNRHFCRAASCPSSPAGGDVLSSQTVVHLVQSFIAVLVQ